ncbi:MAG: ammonium transporter, partial [Mesorhizobium sp.]
MNIPSTLKSAARSALLGSFALGALGTVAAFAEAAPAAAAAAPAFTVDKGDTTWMMVSTVLVLLMTVPGLALFYGGLVRSKNMLSVLMQVFTITSVVMIIWVFYGYSLAFTPGNAFVGGLSKMFLSGVDVTTLSETFTKGVAIPELVFVVFQMTFACITPALIVGAFAERVKFSALILFVILWVTFIYFPIAHMVWFWGGPSAYSDPTGLIFSFGAIDFAGGTVVHINAGIAGLVGALMIGKRSGYK